MMCELPPELILYVSMFVGCNAVDALASAFSSLAADVQTLPAQVLSPRVHFVRAAGSHRVKAVCTANWEDVIVATPATAAVTAVAAMDVVADRGAGDRAPFARVAGPGEDEQRVPPLTRCDVIAHIRACRSGERSWLSRTVPRDARCALLSALSHYTYAMVRACSAFCRDCEGRLWR